MAGDVEDGAFGVAELSEVLAGMGVPVARAVGRREPLTALGLAGVDLLACISALEARYEIKYPGDLVAALATVDDLVHYTNVKLSQR